MFVRELVSFLSLKPMCHIPIENSCNVAQAIRHWPPNLSANGIYGRQSGMQTGFPPSALVFSFLLSLYQFLPICIAPGVGVIDLFSQHQVITSVMVWG
jgi:hypothetical protein